MTAQRVEYTVRISFSTPPKDSKRSIEAYAAAIMGRLVDELAACVDEVEILHRRVSVTPETRPSPASTTPVLCARCRWVKVRFPWDYCRVCKEARR